MLGMDAYMPNIVWANKLKEIGVSISTTGNWLWDKMQTSPKSSIIIPSEYSIAVENLLSVGVEPFAQLFGTPLWARENIPPEQFSVVTKPKLFRDFVKQVLMAYPAIKRWQIYNEIDANLGAPDYFGGWGIKYIQRYIDLIGSVSDLRSNKFKFSVGLMFNDDLVKWSEQFVSRGGSRLINHVNIHYYAYYMDGWGTSELKVYLRDLKEKVKLAISIYGRTPVWITETNAILIGETKVSPAFEEYKAEWFKQAIPMMFDLGIRRVLGYSLRSGWRGADIIGTPSEKVFTDLCSIYND